MITRSAFPRHLIRSLASLRSSIHQEWTINGTRGIRNFVFDDTGLYGFRRRLARYIGTPLLQRWIDPDAPSNALLQEGRLSDAIALMRRRLGRVDQASPGALRRSRPAWTLLADILVLDGHGEEAASIYRRIRDIAPGDFPARWGIENLQRRRATSPQPVPSLPLHFFTIVLNGMPFIERHVDELRKLPVPWHWHIVEGIAELMHDTKWSKSLGGRADASLHRNGLSIDGTTDYLDRLAAAEPDRVTIYRPPPGEHWQGKLAMVRAPLAKIREECLLWEIDVDEFWTAAQIQRMRQRFIDEPARTAAFFLCHYFIKDLVITTANTYGNHIDFEWLRVWRFRPGDFWASHEPPRLCRRPDDSDIAVDVAAVNPFAHGETLADDLVFRHLAYVIPDQLRFKEIYYGYKDAVRQWEQLPPSGPVRLRDHLAWISDEAIADDCEKYAIAPPTLTAPAATETTGRSSLFRSGKTDIALKDFRNILIVKLDNIGDAVLLSPFLRELRANAPDARITLMVREQTADVVALCPYVDRVASVAVEAWGDGFRSRDAEFIAAYERKPFDLAIVPRWDSDEFGAGAIARRSGARRVVGFSEGVSQTKARVNRGFDAHYSDALLKVTSDHTVQQNLALLAFMNGRVSRDALEAWIGPADEMRANALLSPIDKKEQCIAICPGATHPGKIFPPELLLRILSTFPSSWRFVLLGSAAESPLADMLQRGLGARAVSLCGKTSLREAMALLRRCRAAVAMDSGLAHFAAAVQTPVAIFSMHPRHGGNDTLDQSPRRFGPWCAEDRRLVIQPQHAWPGCENGCRWRGRGPHCIANIDIGGAADSLRAFLARHLSSI